MMRNTKVRQEISKYIRNYKFNSIFIKNLILLLLLIILPLIGIVTMTYYGYDNIHKNEIKAYSHSQIGAVSNEVEKMIKDAGTQLTYISHTNEVELFMYPKTEDEKVEFKMKELYDLIKMPVISSDYIKSIYIYSNANESVATIQGYNNFENFNNGECITDYQGQVELGLSPRMLLTQDYSSGYIKNQLSLYYNIKYGEKATGVGVLNIDVKEMVKSLSNENADIYLVCDGVIIYSKNEDEVGNTAGTINGYSDLLVNGNYIENNYSVSMKQVIDENLSIVSNVDMNNYKDNLSAIRGVMVLFVVIMTILTLLLCVYISVKLFSPIKTIITTIEKNKSVLLGEENLLNQHDEIKYIVSSIEKTADKSKDIKNELSQRITLLKKAQSVALQAQINPHFFNNTLETINWTAISLLGGENAISEMVDPLSAMLRMALENTDTIIPIQKEIDHAKMYLQIQEKRYADRFVVVWNISDEIENCKTIKIILQPIIENAIYHGVKMLSSGGVITVSGGLVDDTVTICVTDNGLGISAKQLEVMHKEMTTNVIRESNHIGIVNVNQRLRLYFGDEYGLSIASTINVGTKVFIKFPYIQN